MTGHSPIDAADPEDFRRARTIFEAAIESPLTERTRIIEQACGGDHRLRAAVDAMLRADAEPHPLLDGGLSIADDGDRDADHRWQPGDPFAGHFRIVSFLGRGGMGEVYRAHDATLTRDVALKVLPASSLDTMGLEDRLARFQREAQVLAALNHPNIAAIYGVAEADGIRALVLELVDGPTLADRLRAGPIPIDDVLIIARQIATGLEAAHEQGIVHRDLKPSNIKLRPDGSVKLLDFGLAKVVQSDVVEGAGSQSPTITSPSLTQRGVLLGTAAYMSPEQVKGREADRRSDVWAFGAVLYEMLTGERAFKGDDVTDTLAAVLRADVDDSRLPASTPAAVRSLVSRCLDRNATRRLRDIGEARITLDDLSSASTSASALGGRRQRRASSQWRRAIVPLAAAAVGAGVTALALWPDAAKTAPVMRFALSTSVDETLLVDPQSRDLTITPDGSRVVYKGGARVDRTQLFAYALDQLTPQPLTPLGLPKGPFPSPDGQWIGFFEPGPGGATLKKVAIAGGPPLEVSRLDGPSRGATWGDDDRIIAGSGVPATGLLMIPAKGGDATVLTRPDREHGELDHLWPQFLPGSKAVLYTVTALSGKISDANVAVLDVASGTSKTLIRGASQAYYVPSGHLVYLAGGALWGVAFDPARLETHGTAAVVVPYVMTLPTGAAEFDIARDGTLVYVARGGTSESARTLVWVDRQGLEVPIPAPARPYTNLRLSPDATRVAVDIADDDNDIWVWDLGRETLTRVTNTPGLDQSPVWTMDGRRLVYTSQAGGALGLLFRKAADGSGDGERLTDGQLTQRATDVLPDGSGVLFSDGNSVQMAKFDRGQRVEFIIPPSPRRAAGSGVLSPDGRWLAYGARELGSSPQVFVSPFPRADEGRTLVSRDGGTQPRWSRNGSELFFLALDGTLMSAPVHGGAALSVGAPTRVLQQPYYSGFGLFERPGTYDVAPDGRILMLKQGAGPNKAVEPATVIVVKNWIEELRRLVPNR